MPATLSAASRLREKVLSVPGVVLLAAAGHPDKIIRFQVMPESLLKLKKDYEESGSNKKHVFVNMDRGPDQEAWRDAMDITRRSARRDRPIPDPIQVATDSHEDWSVGEEDVPTIENAIEVPVVITRPIEAVQAIPEKSFSCDTCGKKGIKSNAGLSVHKRKSHPEKEAVKA